MRRGLTLVEMLFTMGIFFLVMVIATALFSETLGFFMKGEGNDQGPREARILLHRLNRTVRTCDRMLEPTYYQLVRMKRTSYFVMRQRVESGHRVVGYRVGPEGIEERIYGLDYRAGEPVGQQLESSRVVARKAADFWLSLPSATRPTLVRVEFSLGGSHSADVNFRTSQ